MSVAGLLLSDSRFPAGGHAHSGGVEPAVTAGAVTDLRTLEVFLRGRLRTAGLVAAGLAAAACAHSRTEARVPGGAGGAESRDEAGRPGRVDGAARDARSGLAGEQGNGTAGESAALVRDDGFWSELDAEADARTPAPAQREASRRQGRALLRAARVAWPGAAGLAGLAGAAGSRGAGAAETAGAMARPRGAGGPGAAAATAEAGVNARQARDDGSRPEYRGGPHHAVVLGAAAAAAGCDPRDAARIAAYQSVAGPASAAVRLLALDPMRATGVLARLAGEVEQIAEQGAACSGGPPGDLPCPSAPALDLLAQAHARTEARLFES
jgi:urease accessory protein